jgi:hypothetical protein
MRTDRQAPNGPSSKPALIRPLGAAPEATPPGLGRRPAAGEQPVAPAEPALVLVLDDAAYDPEHHAIHFRLFDGSRAAACELSLAALQSLAATEAAAGSEESLIAAFRRLADPVRRIVEWKYAAGRLESEGRLQIETADLVDFAARRPKAQAAAPRPQAAPDLAPTGRTVVRAPAELVDSAL